VYYLSTFNESFIPYIFNQSESQDHHENQALCFPGDALVKLVDGRYVYMDQLKVGDQVYVVDSCNNVKSDTVSDFLHINYEDTAKYLEIRLVNNIILCASDEHLIWVVDKSKYLPLKLLKLGEKVNYYNGQEFEQVAVRDIRVVQKKGIFAPLTKEGSILVNSVHFSCFSHYGSFKYKNYHKNAKIATLPIRYGIMPRKYTGKGIHSYARNLMSLNH